MEAVYQFFQRGEFSVPYINISKGEKKMLAFHGYAQSAMDFIYFKSIFNGTYDVDSVNHFFHDQAIYPAIRKHQKPITKKELADLYLNIPSIKKHDKISLIGYSMGGKTALTLLELFPEKIEKVYLMAPDGLYMNPWYKIIVFTSIGRKLMKLTLDNPQIYFRLSSLANKLGFVTDKLHSYFDENMRDKKARVQVYDTWLGYREIIPDLKKIIKNINHHQIDVHLIFGKYDSIITSKIGNDFQIKSDFIHLHNIPCGHMMNNEKVKEVIKKLIGLS